MSSHPKYYINRQAGLCGETILHDVFILRQLSRENEIEKAEVKTDGQFCVTENVKRVDVTLVYLRVSDKDTSSCLFGSDHSLLPNQQEYQDLHLHQSQ